jgi:hypothetical protein
LAVNLLLTAGALLLFSAPSSAVGTPACTEITNRATAAYSIGTAVFVQESNVATTTVAHLIDVNVIWQDAADSDSVILSDSVSSNAALFVGDIDGPGSGPILFTDGATPSGLSYTFTGLDSTTDDVEFSDDGGATFDYEPQPDGAGFDADVTDFRVFPKGTFDASDGANDPSFSIAFRIAAE